MQFVWIENKIGDEEARMIGEGLKSNSTLTVLHLGCDEKRRQWNKKW